MKEIQYYTGALREAQSKRMILFLSTIIPGARKGEVICLPRPPLLLEPNNVEWKPGTWVASLWDTFWSYHMMMNWTTCWWLNRNLHTSIFWLLFFRIHLLQSISFGKVFLGTTPYRAIRLCECTSPSRLISVSLYTLMTECLERSLVIMDYNAWHATMCYAQVHVAFVFCGWKAIKQNRKKMGFRWY